MLRDRPPHKYKAQDKRQALSCTFNTLFPLQSIWVNVQKEAFSFPRNTLPIKALMLKQAFIIFYVYCVNAQRQGFTPTLYYVLKLQIGSRRTLNWNKNYIQNTRLLSTCECWGSRSTLHETVSLLSRECWDSKTIKPRWVPTDSNKRITFVVLFTVRHEVAEWQQIWEIDAFGPWMLSEEHSLTQTKP